MSNIIARGQITIAMVQDGKDGDPGTPAVAWELQPVIERAVVGRDRKLTVNLSYEVVYCNGGERTIVDTANEAAGLSLTAEICTEDPTGNLGGTCSAHKFTKGLLPSLSWEMQSFANPLIVRDIRVSLIVSGELVAATVVPVIMETSAVIDVDNDVGQISQTVYGTTQENGLVNYVTNLTLKVGEIDLSVTGMKTGGGNLVMNGDFADGDTKFGQMGNYTRTIRTDQNAPGFTRCIAMNCTAANQGLYIRNTDQELLFPLTVGLEYVLSFLVKSDADNNIKVGLGTIGTSFYAGAKEIPVGTQWQRVSFTWKNMGVSPWIKIYSMSAANLYVTGIQVEFGNKPSEWSNTAEAMARTGFNMRNRRITVTSDNFEVKNNAGTTTMLITPEGKLSTSLIDVNSLFAQNIDAKNGHIDNLNVDSGTIGGFTIGTYNLSSSGTLTDGTTYNMSLSRESLDMRRNMGGTYEKLVRAEVVGNQGMFKVHNYSPKRAGDPDTNTAMIVKAGNRSVNIAMLAEGSVLVGGMAEGYAVEQLLSTVQNYVYSLDLRKSNRFRIIPFATGQKVQLPSRSNILGIFGNNAVNFTRFCIRILILSRGYKYPVTIIGRDSTDTSYNYPQIYGDNGQNANSYTLQSGKCVEVFLVYDSTDNVEQMYTAYIK